MPTNFIYFSSGKNYLHNRTIFSVLSLLAYHRPQDNEKILIYTDQPAFYQKFLSDLPVEYHLLTSKQIEEKIGIQGLIHRIKISVIEEATLLYPQNSIFYIDSDTFFYEEFKTVLTKISPKTSVMHKFEYPMEFLGSYPLNDKDHFRDVYEVLSNSTFIIRGKEILIPPTSFASWNAGIIGLHPAHFDCFQEVYELTDQLYIHTHNHACEQYAFSYFLQKRTQLIGCEEYNRHYWHRIEKKIVDEFLAKRLTDDFAQLPLDRKKELVKKWTQYLLKKIPKHEYMHRYNAMIAFQERRFIEGYKEAIKTLLANPLQDWTFFRDIAYHTKRIFKKDEV